MLILHIHQVAIANIGKLIRQESEVNCQTSGIEYTSGVDG